MMIYNFDWPYSKYTNTFINTIYAQLGQYFGLTGAGSDEVNSIENAWNFITVNVTASLLSIGVFTFIYNVIPQKENNFQKNSTSCNNNGAITFELVRSHYLYFIFILMETLTWFMAVYLR